MRLFLFGSKVKKKYTRDIDIFIDNFTEREIFHVKILLKPYALEKGGKLDLFVWNGHNLSSVYSDRTIFGDVDLNSVACNCKEISLQLLLTMLKGDVK